MIAMTITMKVSMSHLKMLFWLMFVSLYVARAQTTSKVFNVKTYGAVAEAKTDNSKAFLTAWGEACQCNGWSTVLIPAGTYMLGPLVFQGPCKGPVVFKNEGVVKASTDLAVFKSDPWISFQHIDNLTIDGGSFDGQGASAWPHNDCKKKGHCTHLPINIKFHSVNNSRIQYITSINSKYFHLGLNDCTNMDIIHINISAPGDSPNTDGIHIGRSSGIRISKSMISTGDDCVSIGPGSKAINISEIFCGPGHGISVGSLGKYQNEEDVIGVTVRNCTLQGTTNGMRIKTWAPSPPSVASNLIFEHIDMINVANPILIDQQYCPFTFCSRKGPSEVQLKSIKFKNIWGASNTSMAVILRCSQRVPCQNVELEDINLAYSASNGPTRSSCSFAYGTSAGVQNPPSCLPK